MQKERQKKDKEEKGEEEEAFSQTIHESQKNVQERESLLSLNAVNSFVNKPTHRQILRMRVRKSID